MEKLIVCLIFMLTELTAMNMGDVDTLENECLACHKSQQIPDDLIYRRYLMVYSTSSRMEKAIFSYIKNPDKKNSIMHHPFFFKFPMKKTLDLEDAALSEMIRKYLIVFDVRNKFTTSE